MANLLVLSYGEVNRPWYPRHIEGLLLADSSPPLQTKRFAIQSTSLDAPSAPLRAPDVRESRPRPAGGS